MSDEAKPYTVEEAHALPVDDVWGPDDLCSMQASPQRIVATARALEAERAAHEKAERERDEARARIAQLEEALRRIEDQLAHDQSAWEHDHEDDDAKPWDECRACTYDAMLRDLRTALLATPLVTP